MYVTDNPQYIMNGFIILVKINSTKEYQCGKFHLYRCSGHNAKYFYF
jgi:hypothetical protein